MAKPFSRILDQIERLQKEAAAIQSGVVDRIRKEIAEYGLTPEQLFGAQGSGRKNAGKKTRAQIQPGAKTPKFADGAGNTWGGMGKRPDWVRQALDAGKTLDDFLIGKVAKTAPAKKGASKKPSAKPGPAPKPVAVASKKAPAPAAKKKAVPAKKAAAKKAAAPKRRQSRAARPTAEAAAS